MRDRTNGDGRKNLTNNQNNMVNNQRRKNFHHANKGARAPILSERNKKLDLTRIVAYPKLYRIIGELLYQKFVEKKINLLKHMCNLKNIVEQLE